MNVGQADHDRLLARRERAVPRGPFNVHPLFAARAAGARLWDVTGREYLDFCGGIGVLNVGHNHPRVVEAVRRQSERLVHSCWHVAMYEPYVQLAERLNALAPVPAPAKTAFFTSGAEAGENAVKVARAATGRAAVVCFERGFHGRTLLGMTMTGKVRPYTAGFGPFAPEVYRLPWVPFFRPARPDDDDAVRAGVDTALAMLFAYHVEPAVVACVIMEPVLGEGGFYPAHPVAAQRLREVCREHGIVFAGDEVQSGFARCGAMFGCERLKLDPDLVLTAKSLAGGLPLSAVTGRADLMDAPGVGGIGGTFGGNPVACAAGLAVLDVIDEEGLVERARRIGARVMKAFGDWQAAHAHVAGARGLGAMCGLDVVDPATAGPDPERAARLTTAARERGLLIMTASGNVLRTLMPLVISDEELERGLESLDGAIGSTGD
ncbi:MAG: 4-aminobutyrate--2-oxoglutarate transaminase [Candidatus Krumholzibacteriia bacterium]